MKTEREIRKEIEILRKQSKDTSLFISNIIYERINTLKWVLEK